MDAKARQDCIKEIDLLKVKNQRRGRRRHALRSVLLRCLSWDLLPHENNWSAPDGVDLRAVCACVSSDCYKYSGVLEHLCTRVRMWISVCVLLSPWVCVCVQRYSSVKSPQAHIGSFLMPKLLCFFVLLFFNNLFVMFKTSQQCISMEM